LRVAVRRGTRPDASYADNLPLSEKIGFPQVKFPALE
jgi:hypothetical protein